MEPDRDALLGMARNLREGNETFVPMIAWQPRSGPVVMACVSGDGTIDEVMGQALPKLREDFGDPEWFAVAADTYGRNSDADDQVPPGSLGEAFQNGDPLVTEQVVLLVAEATGITGVRQTYRYTPVEGWEWDDPLPFNDTTTSLEEVMRSNI